MIAKKHAAFTCYGVRELVGVDWIEYPNKLGWVMGIEVELSGMSIWTYEWLEIVLMYLT